jgi:hypothetical protein
MPRNGILNPVSLDNARSICSSITIPALLCLARTPPSRPHKYSSPKIPSMPETTTVGMGRRSRVTPTPMPSTVPPFFRCAARHGDDGRRRGQRWWQTEHRHAAPVALLVCSLARLRKQKKAIFDTPARRFPHSVGPRVLSQGPQGGAGRHREELRFANEIGALIL